MCYQVKDRAIDALLKHGAASLHSLELADSGLILGVEFVGGGRLHVRPGCLGPNARGKFQAQFSATLQRACRDVITKARYIKSEKLGLESAPCIER